MKDELQRRLDDAKKNERHRNAKETSYWCAQYKLLAGDAVATLSAAPAPSAEVEAVEVVGYKSKFNGLCDESSHCLYDPEPLMTVAQHQRIVAKTEAGWNAAYLDRWNRARDLQTELDEMVAAKDAEIARLNDYAERYAAEAVGLRAQLAAQQAAVPDVLEQARRHLSNAIEDVESEKAMPALASLREVSHYLALLTAPAAPQQGDSITRELLERVARVESDDYLMAIAELREILGIGEGLEVARLNADRSAQGEKP